MYKYPKSNIYKPLLPWFKKTSWVKHLDIDKIDLGSGKRSIAKMAFTIRSTE